MALCYIRTVTQIVEGKLRYEITFGLETVQSVKPNCSVTESFLSLEQITQNWDRRWVIRKANTY